jgi:hypothetical protein
MEENFNKNTAYKHMYFNTASLVSLFIFYCNFIFIK